MRTRESRLEDVEDDAERLKPALPTAAECAAVARHLETMGAGHLASLGVAERFAIAARNAGDHVALLDSALHVNSFEAHLEHVVCSADVVLAAAKTVLASEGLAKTLRHILAVGNAMNEGTSRGDAVGVKLASLAQIVHTKGRDRSTTVLDYVVRALIKRGHAQALRSAARDLPDVVARAKRVPVADVLREARALAAAAETCDRALNVAEDRARDLDAALHDEECDAMAEHEATRFFDTFTRSVGFSLFKAEQRRKSRLLEPKSLDERKRRDAAVDDRRRRRRAHAVAGRRVARLSAFVKKAALAAADVRNRIDAVTEQVDLLCDYFGEDDSTRIMEDLHVFLDALVVALKKANDDDRGRVADEDYDHAGGSAARQLILDRREALFPSNPQ